MGNIFDFDSPAKMSGFAPRVPGSVRKFNAVATPRGDLVLRWKPPRGASVTAYRIERTREGREYEPVGEVTEGFFVVNPSPGEPWFYRVTAFNARGSGGFAWVAFFRRGDRFLRGGQNRDSLLHHIPVKPGRQVNVWE